MQKDGVFFEVAVLTLAAGVFSGCGGGGGSSAPPAPPNFAPTANAGPTQYVATGSLVTLDGSASTDANGDPLTYLWTVTGGASAANPTAVTTTFVATASTVYTATLTACDAAICTTSQATIFATPPGVSLLEVDILGRETLSSLPFNVNRTQSITASSPIKTVARFKLVAQGAGPFTITNLSVGQQVSGITTSFAGLTEGQLIAARNPIPFSLLSTSTNGAQVSSFHYTFDIPEQVGATFQYTVRLTTN